MKKRQIILLFFICLICGGSLFGQNAADDFFDGDIDSLFGPPSGEDIPKSDPQPEAEPENAPSVLSDVIKKIGFTLDARFDFAGGYAPGWRTAPWYWTTPNQGYSDVLLAKMQTIIGLEFQFSDILRVRQSFSFDVPNLDIGIDEFFFDYNVFDTLFFRAGKFTVNWGISPNFQYTNLPSRIPSSAEYPGDIYAARVDIPIGIGGFQLIGLTRSGFLTSDNGPVDDVSFEHFSLGLKYNAAVPLVDVDAGFLYNQKMASRAFVSLKTTLFSSLELYSEAMVSYNLYNLNGFSGSGSIGFFQDFFDGRLSINGEYFYNGEKNASLAQDSNFFKKNEILPFIYGSNTALNIRYKPSWFKRLELFVSYLHGFNENTAQLAPGFRINPFSNLYLYVAVPMALGSKTGTYYTSNADEKNRPFAITMLITFSGNLRYSFTGN